MEHEIELWDFQTAIVETILEIHAGEPISVVEALRQFLGERGLLNKRGEFIEAGDWKKLGF